MKGFTLIELLVVITIMAILVVVIVPSYGSYSNNQKLSDAAKQLQTILRQAQNNAQTGTVCPPYGGSTSKAIHWEVSLSSGSISNKSYSFYPVCEDGYRRSLQTTTLPTGVTISHIYIDTCSPSVSLVRFNNVSSEILFIDPAAGCLDATNSKLEIQLSLAGSSNPRRVVVEKGGGIYVVQ